MTTHEIIGKPVVSMADGEKVGDVKDLKVDTAALRVSALVIAAEHGKFDLPWENLKSVGSDAIMIEDKSPLLPFGEPMEPVKEWKNFFGTNVVDGTGSVIGTVHELLLDEAGQIRSLQTKAGGVFGIGAKDSTVSVEEIRGIGPRLVTVERTLPSV